MKNLPGKLNYNYDMLISQTYTLLCKSDVERAEWKEAIIPLLEQAQGKNVNNKKKY